MSLQSSRRQISHEFAAAFIVAQTYRCAIVCNPGLADLLSRHGGAPCTMGTEKRAAETRDRTGDLQIFGLTLSQLSYRGCCSDAATLQYSCLLHHCSVWLVRVAFA